jgi:Na+/melibiose symporter-like transporter
MVFATTDSGEECEGEGEMAVTAYYSAFVVLFQFGWATTQISHLSMIPDITSNEKSRMALTSIRYAATVMSNILVYGVTWLLLETSKHITNLRNEDLDILS